MKNSKKNEQRHSAGSVECRSYGRPIRPTNRSIKWIILGAEPELSIRGAVINKAAALGGGRCREGIV